ncbi:N-formylglutamate amidohydrolase (plasmid) [Agrobacterium leguminum]|uniref:N-formylglutamate amidohydrolase n=1 Tax=Agrobacterium leguminum TaxID=2792015 RepID=UPI002729A099|nr:N-formylglutamate amidohydrolase [Agrobacterium leguminum]WLE00810.1 N-formylglutamate amidohydrolase [Agrobacterium leguminum]
MNQRATLSEAEIASYASDAVSVLDGARRPDIVLLCEHGGCRVPDKWRGLGLHEAFFETHYAHDIGSRDLTTAVANRLGATAVLANYSRLFLDYNRKANDPSCVRPDMGGIPVPANLHISDEERFQRERIARSPVERVLENLLEGERPVGKLIVSIHSFSPVWEADYRSCQIGVMWKYDGRLALPLIQAMNVQRRFAVEENQPYSFADSDWFTLDRHGLSIAVPNAYIEVRNDLIQNASAVSDMAEVIAVGIEKAATSLSR